MFHRQPFIIFGLIFVMLSGAMIIAFSQGCPDCFFDNDQPMNGPSSADGRRTISVKIDATWEQRQTHGFGMVLKQRPANGMKGLMGTITTPAISWMCNRAMLTRK